MDFTLTQEQYETLVALARKGSTTEDQARDTDAFIRTIEAKNGITRYYLLVQWQEIDSPLPPRTRFPSVWPPELRGSIEFLSRPVAKSDVLSLLKERARQPTNVLVTTDPGGVLGWTKLDEFFQQ